MFPVHAVLYGCSSEISDYANVSVVHKRYFSVLYLLGS